MRSNCAGWSDPCKSQKVSLTVQHSASFEIFFVKEMLSSWNWWCAGLMCRLTSHSSLLQFSCAISDLKIIACLRWWRVRVGDWLYIRPSTAQWNVSLFLQLTAITKTSCEIVTRPATNTEILSFKMVRVFHPISRKLQIITLYSVKIELKTFDAF